MRWTLISLLLATPSLARDLHEAEVLTDSQLAIDTSATVSLRTFASSGPRRRRGVASAVRVKLGAVLVFEGRTDAQGLLNLRFAVPRRAPGSATLEVHTQSGAGSTRFTRRVQIVDRRRLHLQVDRPVYRPGDTLHWRVVSVNEADARPRAGTAVQLSLQDAKKTVIWKGEVKTDATGMIAGALPLGEDLVGGTWTLRARAGALSAQSTLQVRRIELPPFALRFEVEAEVTPGERLKGALIARYAYGEPVAGSARVLDGALVVAAGPLVDGRLAFDLEARAGLELRASVRDGAQRKVTLTWGAPVASERLVLSLVPESATLPSGRVGHLTVITTDAQGRLVPARLRVRSTKTWRGRSPGALRVPVTITRRRPRIEVEARTADGRVAVGRLEAKAGTRRVVRPREVVLAPGAPLEIQGGWTRPEGRLVATLLRKGVPLVSAPVQVRGGQLRGRLDPPAGLLGLTTLRISELRAGATLDASASVYFRPRRLALQLSTAQRVRPGARVPLRIEVRDAAGAPAAGVGLAASVTDERALSLGALGPDLFDALRSADVEGAQRAGLSFVALLERSGAAPRAALRALLETLPSAAPRPQVHEDREQRRRSERSRLSRLAPRLAQHLAGRGRTSRFEGGRWDFERPLAELLAEAGLPGKQRQDPWGKPLRWTYARSLAPAFRHTTLARRVAELRLQALATRVGQVPGARGLLRGGGLAGMVSGGHLDAGLAVDPWGRGIRARRGRLGGRSVTNLVAAGPDGQVGSADDVVFQDAFGEAGGLGIAGMGLGAGGRSLVSYGRGAGSYGKNRPGRAAVLRARFDETVLWSAGLRTDGEGRAELQVPYGDSITGWRVAVEALGPEGALGRAHLRAETFLPHHVDAELPKRLIAGDRYSVPVVVANHGAAPLEARLDAQLGGGLALDAPSFEARLTLPPGSVRALSVAVRANEVGAGRLQLRLWAEGEIIDRSERSLRIEAPGVRVQRGVALSDGPADFEVPATVAPGSFEGTLRLYRGPSDMALEGVESLLSEPHGCFEQTSSTTHPNLLVLQLLKGLRGQEKAVERATELVAKGYQRLLSYEVAGGGFEWFGRAPANKVLTAYGLLEFSDMARVYPVDPALIERTRAWLLAQQGADGSWTPDPRWLHDWSAVQGRASTTAYVAWALRQSGYEGPALTKALRFLAAQQAALATKPYLLALWAGARGPSSASATSVALPPLAALQGFAREEAPGLAFGSGGQNLFYARGPAADVQVTALVAPLLSATRGEQARAWLWSKRSPRGGWGNTQSTMLSLRALALEPPSAREGTAEALLDGRRLGGLDLDAPEVPSLALAPLPAGKHQIELRAEGRVRGDLQLRWRSTEPPGALSEGLEVEVHSPTSVGLREALPLKLSLLNPGKEAVAMPTVVLPVPPGFAVREESLKRLKAQGRIARYEDVGSALHLYLDSLAPQQRVELPLSLEGRARCEVTWRGAEAYAYYTPEVRGRAATRRLTLR